MQRIIEQSLCGNKEAAEKEARYTWRKNMIAYYFCSIRCNIFKVKFTGKHWIVGNKWGYTKIYQYQYLESSDVGTHVTDINHIDNISHGEERDFYTTKKEALDEAYYHINRVAKEAISKEAKDIVRLRKYEDIP